MTAGVLPGEVGRLDRPAVVAAPRGGGLAAEVALARRSFRQVRTGAIVCALTFGGTFASSALAYASTFPPGAARQQLAAATSGEPGLSMLLGPIAQIDTVGGYTVYKCFVFLTVIGALWGLLAATRLLRGEEDTGRFQLAIAGATRPARATAATLVALGTAVVVAIVGTIVIALVTTRDPSLDLGAGNTVLYGLSLAIAPAVFVAVGAVTSQLGRTRRVATGLGAAVFGIAFLLRMLADSGPSTRWLLWTTPFGWTELVAPYTANDLRPLAVAAVAVAVLSMVAIVLSSRRDVGSGVLATRDAAALRPFGLRSPLGLAARLEAPVLAVWIAGIAASGLVLGIIAKLTTSPAPGTMGDTLARFGVHGDFAAQYLGVAFLLLATTVALLPAHQLGAARDEELSGRLTGVLVQPARRWRWLGGRLLLAAGAIVAASFLAGAGAWLGAVSQGVDVDLSSTLVAGLNLVPTALVVLSVGAVVLALAPRAAGIAVYVVVGWSLFADLVGSMVTGAAWLGRLSIFDTMALAPAEDPDPRTLAITTAVAVALAAASLVAFGRRDVTTG